MFIDTSGFGIRLSKRTFVVFDALGFHASWRGGECAWTHDYGWSFSRFRVTLGWKDGLMIWRFDNGSGWQVRPGRYGLKVERMPLFPEYRGLETMQAA